MHRTLALLAILALSSTISAAQVRSTDPEPGPAARRESVRQFIIEPEHVLSEGERAELQAAGIEVSRALSSGRYLVRAASADAFAGTERLIRDVEPLTAELKLHPTAIREAVKSRAYARLSLIFENGVAFDDARALVEAAGGHIDDMLQYEFEPMQRVVVRIPAQQIDEVASDERVIAVYGAPRLRIVGENALEADISKVTPLREAPYGLTGKNIVLSLFELGAPDAAHPEFGGRLVNKFTGGTDIEHATHVSGTLIASGIQPAAKGMAPDATLNAFEARSGYLKQKEQTLPVIGSVADNNSWGYVFGWNNDNGWVWTANDDLYGGYIDINASVDKIARSGGTLFVHSSGNDASKLGPTAAPYAHQHEDENGDKITDKTFCYSENGSGTDCPAPCTAGPQYCEIVRHPVNAPWTSVGLLASSKNVVTVGALIDATNIATFSSRGPTRDGRVKPDVVAVGVGVYSTVLNNAYGRKNGTSMSSPVVTGISGLLVEQWRKTFNGANPAPVVVKTLLIEGADDIGNAGPDYTFGHGLVNAKASVDTIIADGAAGNRIRIADATQGSQLEIPLAVSSAQNLRVTLGWSDPEVLNFGPDGLAAQTLVNDLDLRVIDPSGATVLPYVLNKNSVDAPATRGVNTVDNVEVVEIANATPGNYRVLVNGTRITASSPQQFVVAANAQLGAAVAPCTDPTEPNDTAATAYGFLGSTQSVMARLCAASDVDYFKFRADHPGTISLRVTATDTPLAVTLSGGGTAGASANVAAGETKTVVLQYAGSTSSTFTIQVTPNGAIGANASYFVSPTFPLTAPVRRRSTLR